MSEEPDDTSIKLPDPRRDSRVSVEQTLSKRRSVREFADAPLSIGEAAQLLWAAQGLNGPQGRRTAPSAGGLYPLELYVLAGRVEGMDPGVYRYNPDRHLAVPVLTGDLRAALAEAALDQAWIKRAPAVFVFTAVYERTTWKYGRRGVPYVHMEVGHAAQNLNLQAVAMNLGGVMVGAFDDQKVKSVLKLAPDEVPLYLVPVGRP
jgi:SagB-type dehydrogenase family enzyme